MKQAFPIFALTLFAPVAFAQSAGPRPEKPSDLEVWITGDSADAAVQAVNGPALLLMGGSVEVDAGFRDQAFPVLNGGDILVLRASGSDGYNDYLYEELTTGPLQPNSVETIKFDNRGQSDSDYVKWAIDTAELIWFAGGDQSDYLNYWAGTPVQTAVQAAWDRGAVLGGTSAGLAIMGEFIYDPDGVRASSGEEAIDDPYNDGIILSDRFLEIPWMDGIVTDTHFKERDRMGRPLAFMAQLREEGRADSITALGISERTSMFIDKDGIGTVLGRDAAYLIFESVLTERVQVQPGEPLVYRNLRRVKLEEGDTVDFSKRTTSKPAMWLSVDGTQPQPFNPSDPYADYSPPAHVVWMVY